MTKEECLYYCTQCTNRGFHREKGVVCKLTNDEPAFERSCDDFLRDENMLKQMEQRKKDQEAIEQSQSVMGGTNAGIIGGIIMMVGAVVWFIVGYYAGYIFFYPPILFIIGVIAVVRGVMKQKEKMEEKRKQQIDVLDNFKDL
ncbi:MAG: hypothetical protein ACOZCO_16720 [Bacteroidota bacterium]